MNKYPLSEALANAERLVDRATLDAAITAMAKPIARDYAGEVPVYLTVMHGALPFAGQLSLELGALGLDLEFDYLHATRYRGETTGGELVWKHRPATALYGRRVFWWTTSWTRVTPLPPCASGAWSRAPPTCASPR